nr:unnamed protein product [Callosobruchus analis]
MEALKIHPEGVSELKSVETSMSKMEWHAEATISEGSIMLSIPETDDDMKKRKTSRAPISTAPTPVNSFGLLTNMIYAEEKRIIQSGDFNVIFNKNNA